MGKTLTRAFVWVVLAIFVLTSVGVALISFSAPLAASQLPGQPQVLGVRRNSHR